MWQQVTTSQRKMSWSSVSKLRNGTHYRYPSYGTVSEQKNMNQSVMGFCQSWSHSLILCIAQDLQAKINPAYVKTEKPQPHKNYKLKIDQSGSKY